MRLEALHKYPQHFAVMLTRAIGMYQQSNIKKVYSFLHQSERKPNGCDFSRFKKKLGFQICVTFSEYIYAIHLYYRQAFLRVSGERSTKTKSLRDHSLKRGRISSRSTTVLYRHVGIFVLRDCFYCAWYVSKVVYMT